MTIVQLLISLITLGCFPDGHQCVAPKAMHWHSLNHTIPGSLNMLVYMESGPHIHCVPQDSVIGPKIASQKSFMLKFT